MRAKLVVVGGDIGSAEIPLKLPVTIGRSRDVALTLPHPLVSRRHCEIFEAEGRLRVRDLGSRNGTYVANVRVEEAWLPTGELLTIGNVTFRAVYDESAVLPKPTGTVRLTETIRTDLNQEEATSAEGDGSRLVPGRNVYDSSIPLSDDDLFREDDLSDEGLGVDSGHFGDFDTEPKK
jgi:pSer/pThr/pTyr-binding forkhead associated (FHA) protein